MTTNKDNTALSPIIHIDELLPTNPSAPSDHSPPADLIGLLSELTEAGILAIRAREWHTNMLKQFYQYISVMTEDSLIKQLRAFHDDCIETLSNKLHESKCYRKDDDTYEAHIRRLFRLRDSRLLSTLQSVFMMYAAPDEQDTDEEASTPNIVTP